MEFTDISSNANTSELNIVEVQNKDNDEMLNLVAPTIDTAIQTAFQANNLEDLNVNQNSNKVKDDPNIDKQSHRNKELESKYQKKQYGVLLTGKNSSVFHDDIFDRLSEIERCTGVNKTTMAQIFPNERTQESQLKIIFDDYEDYMRILDTWPNDAFNAGVIAEAISPNLSVVILNVDKTIEISSRSQKIKDLEHRYGLINIQRIFVAEHPSNKLRASVKTLKDFVDVVEKGIYLDSTSKKHVVIPNIMHGRVCGQCGDLNHRDKECKHPKRCLKCASFEHKSQDCTSQKIRCINCSKAHQCNSEQCEKMAEKT